MSYVTPKIKSVRMDDVLSQVGPARALMYVPGADGGTSSSSGSQSSSSSSSSSSS